MNETIWTLKDVSFEVKRGFALLGAMGRARVTSDFVGYDGADDRASTDLWARSILFIMETGFHPDGARPQAQALLELAIRNASRAALSPDFYP